MGVASGILYGSGFRFGCIFELNANNRLKGNSASVPYMGIPFVGHKAWNLTIPKMRRINHINADRVGATDFLPPTEAGSGTIAVSADNMPLDQAVTGNKNVTIGNALTIADLTSNQGFEPFVALHLYQQAINYSGRTRSWRSFLIPTGKLAQPQVAGFADREVDGNYEVLLNPSDHNIFGAALTGLLDGCTDAQLFRMMTASRPAIAAWVGDGYTVDFTFPAGFTPTVDAGSVSVWVNGVKKTTGVTVITTKVTFAVAPLSNDDIDIAWEY